MESSPKKLTPLEYFLADTIYYWMPVPGGSYGKAVEEAVNWAAPQVKKILREYPDEKMTRNEYDIPTEVVLPYIVRERDRALKKVETLTEYARSLEDRIDEMARERDALEAQLGKEPAGPTAKQRKAAKKYLSQAVAALKQMAIMEGFV